MTSDTNTWSEWQRHVLAELIRLSNCIEDMRNEFKVVDDRMTRVEERATMRAALVGGLAALVPVAIAIALRLL